MVGVLGEVRACVAEERFGLLDFVDAGAGVEVECRVEAQRGVGYFHRAGEFTAYIEDGRVISDGFVVVRDGIYTRGLTCSNYRDAVQFKLRGYGVEGDGGEVDEAVLCWGNANFGHWVFQFLTRMVGVARGELISKPVLVNRSVPVRFLQWLELMGFKCAVVADDWVRVRRLWVPSVVNYRGHYEDPLIYISPGSVNGLRASLGVERGRGGRRIFIGRRGARWRRIVNEDEVLGVLEGFEAPELEKMSAREQLDLISDASEIVVACGGASPITMFAPRCAHIIELNQMNLKAPFGSHAWAWVLGQDFERLDGEAIEGPPGRRKIDLDYRVDAAELKKRLH